MKVGLFLKNLKSEIGGGSTFEIAIFQALLRYAAESNHTFTIFSWSKDIEKQTSTEQIKFVPLKDSYFGRSFSQRLESRLTKAGNRILENLRLNSLKTENLVEEFIINSGVEMFWYLELGTYDYLTLEIPYITTVWDLAHRNQPYFPEVSTRGRWDRREKSYGLKIKRAAINITGTEAGKAEIERFYQVSSDCIKVIPFLTPAFALNASVNKSKDVLAKYKISENYLFYPAQFWPHKNHAGLLLALQLLRDEYNLKFPLVLVGADKGNQDYVRELVTKLELSAQVHFLGFVPQEDLIQLYRNAFALTFLTFFGPDNLPPLEAFALSCPVIASMVSGAQEQLQDAALLVDPKDEKQIALAIKSLHDSPELRQQLIQRGLERGDRWTSKDYINSIFSILDEFEKIRRCWSSEKPFRQR